MVSGGVRHICIHKKEALYIESAWEGRGALGSDEPQEFCMRNWKALESTVRLDWIR